MLVRPAVTFLAGWLLLSAATFAVLAEEALEGERLVWNVPLLRWAHAHDPALVNALMHALTAIGGGAPALGIALVVALALALRGLRTGAALVAVSELVVVLLVEPLKSGFHEARPALFGVHDAGYGFPSGHAAQSMALAASLVIALWPMARRVPLASAAALYTFAVGVSRIYLGAHYPSEVVAGWCLGLAVVCALVLAWLAARQLPR